MPAPSSSVPPVPRPPAHNAREDGLILRTNFYNRKLSACNNNGAVFLFT